MKHSIFYFKSLDSQNKQFFFIIHFHEVHINGYNLTKRFLQIPSIKKIGKIIKIDSFLPVGIIWTKHAFTNNYKQKNSYKSKWLWKCGLLGLYSRILKSGDAILFKYVILNLHFFSLLYFSSLQKRPNSKMYMENSKNHFSSLRSFIFHHKIASFLH